QFCVSRTFLDQLRRQLLRPWIPSAARDIYGGPRRFTQVVLDEQSLPVAGSGSGLLTLRPLRPQVSRTAGSGDPRRTKQIRNDSSRDQGAVKTNFAACQPRGQLPGLVAGAAPLVVAGAAGAAGGKRSLGMGLISILARFRSSVSKFF